MAKKKQPHEGMVLGKWCLERKLGEGGMASVWLARHMTLQTPFAVKILNPEMAEKNPRLVTRFLREARLASTVRHRHLVSVSDIGKDRATGFHYLVMEYLPGGNISSRLRTMGPMSEGAALLIVRQVAEALEKAASQAMVHRDIKPDNIMFDESGDAKLTDLGIAKCDDASSAHLTQTASVFGTPAYMSPEQAQDSGKVDARADIYSLGVVFYEMLTGQCPYRGDTIGEILARIVAQTPPPDVRKIRPDVSKETAELIHQMMAKSVTERPVSATVLVQNLKRLEEAFKSNHSNNTSTCANPEGAPTIVSSGTLPTQAFAPTGTLPTQALSENETLPTQAVDAMGTLPTQAVSAEGTLPTQATQAAQSSSATNGSNMPGDEIPVDVKDGQDGSLKKKLLILLPAVMVMLGIAFLFVMKQPPPPESKNSPVVVKELPQKRIEVAQVKQAPEVFPLAADQKKPIVTVEKPKEAKPVTVQKQAEVSNQVEEVLPKAEEVMPLFEQEKPTVKPKQNAKVAQTTSQEVPSKEESSKKPENAIVVPPSSPKEAEAPSVERVVQQTPAVAEEAAKTPVIQTPALQQVRLRFFSTEGRSLEIPSFTIYPEQGPAQEVVASEAVALPEGTTFRLEIPGWILPADAIFQVKGSWVRIDGLKQEPIVKTVTFDLRDERGVSLTSARVRIVNRVFDAAPYAMELQENSVVTVTVFAGENESRRWELQTMENLLIGADSVISIDVKTAPIPYEQLYIRDRDGTLLTTVSGWMDAGLGPETFQSKSPLALRDWLENTHAQTLPYQLTIETPLGKKSFNFAAGEFPEKMLLDLKTGRKLLNRDEM